jgi:hypothetical protein
MRTGDRKLCNLNLISSFGGFADFHQEIRRTVNGELGKFMLQTSSTTRRNYFEQL